MLKQFNPSPRRRTACMHGNYPQIPMDQKETVVSELCEGATARPFTGILARSARRAKTTVEWGTIAGIPQFNCTRCSRNINRCGKEPLNV